MKLAFLAFCIGIVGVVAANDGNVEWSYDGARGPAKWGDLSNNYRTCSVGKQQSPINLVSGRAEYVTGTQQSALSFNWKKLGATPIVNNGHTVQLDIQSDSATDNYVTFNNENVYSDTEMHLVHKSASNKLLVVGVLFRVSNNRDNNWLAPIIQHLPKGSGEKKTVSSLDLSALLKDVNNFNEYWTYLGSLTVPPCTENVRWLVYGKDLPFSVTQYIELRNVLKFNSRFTHSR
ncbi:alpha carbonic anhydrase [Syncephalis plumigaleata]|nr:alpha carbonic anhydrase [Syncephalis plumigaleata]